jgi:Rrf2 family transcriptional regulator, nitric oxide-sensitive transcriptional repressor
MIRISRDVEYALIALKSLHLARPGELTSVRAICATHNLPFDATSHVLQRLKRAEVVRSEQGVRGGYQLIKDLSKLTLMELLEIVGTSTNLMGCMENPCGCELVGTCNIISPLVMLSQRLTEFYRDITVKELFEARSPREKSIRLRFQEQTHRQDAGAASAV